MKKIFSTNKGTALVYIFFSLLAVLISCLSLLSDNQFNYYPIVVTAISFVFGGFYLIASLFSMTKKVQLSQSKGVNIMTMMGSNFLRFSILIISVVVCFLFIYFGPRTGEIEKWVYFLILICGLPMPINILLFYIRGKYAE